MEFSRKDIAELREKLKEEDEKKKEQSAGVHCPACDSTRWECNRSPIDPAEDRFKCMSCGHSWRRYDKRLA